jgi:hypothetical protein
LGCAVPLFIISNGRNSSRKIYFFITMMFVYYHAVFVWYHHSHLFL